MKLASHSSTAWCCLAALLLAGSICLQGLAGCSTLGASRKEAARERERTEDAVRRIEAAAAKDGEPEAAAEVARGRAAEEPVAADEAFAAGAPARAAREGEAEDADAETTSTASGAAMPPPAPMGGEASGAGIGGLFDDLGGPARTATPPASRTAPPGKSDGKGERPAPARRPARRVDRRPAPASPGVQAGYADDNKQFNLYLDYLQRNSDLDHLALDVSNRIRLSTLDADGKSLHNCLISLKDPRGKLLQRRRTYADGRALLFPSEDPTLQVQGLKVTASCLGQERGLVLDPHGRRDLELRFDVPRPVLPRVPLDVAFLIDTTGSMGDEIARLKATLEVIHFQITHLASNPEVRFGMVLYRDRGDDYVTRVIPFTADVEAFARELAKVEAGGGGDGPEDLQEGLRRALQDLRWNEQGVRLLFLLADAQPHLDYDQPFTYVEAMKAAAERAVKIVSIGASGLPPEGEIVFRQLAQYTQGLFIFLTYGEKGESDGGTGASVSHHTGANWQARDLDGIVVQMVKRELSHLTDRPVDDGQDYFETTSSVAQADRDSVLAELFDKGTSQLVKFSTMAIEPRTATTVLPIAVSKGKLDAAAEQVEDRILLALAKDPSFQVVERRDAQKLLDELRRSGSDLFDSEQSAKVGKLLGARLAVISKLTPKEGRLELFLKLVRVETGEVLSMTMLKLDEKLLR